MSNFSRLCAAPCRGDKWCQFIFPPSSLVGREVVRPSAGQSPRPWLPSKGPSRKADHSLPSAVPLPTRAPSAADGPTAASAPGVPPPSVPVLPTAAADSGVGWRRPARVRKRKIGQASLSSATVSLTAMAAEPLDRLPRTIRAGSTNDCRNPPQRGRITAAEPPLPLANVAEQGTQLDPPRFFRLW